MTEPAVVGSLPREHARRQLMIREAVQLSCLGGAAISVLPALLGRPQLAVSILLGTLLAGINFVLLARGIANALGTTVERVEQTKRERGLGPEATLEPKEVSGLPRGASSFLRLVLFLAVIAGLFWYPPAEPWGLAVGVLVVLIGSSVAAYREQRAAPKVIDPHGG